VTSVILRTQSISAVFKPAVSLCYYVAHCELGDKLTTHQANFYTHQSLTVLFLPRDSYAKRGIYRRRVSVYECVCVSFTLRYCIKMAKRRIMQITLHNSTMTSFLMPKIMAKFQRDHPLRGRQMQVGWVKIGHFRRKRAITRKRYKIDV